MATTDDGTTCPHCGKDTTEETPEEIASRVFTDYIDLGSVDADGRLYVNVSNLWSCDWGNLEREGYEPAWIDPELGPEDGMRIRIDPIDEKE